MGKKLLLTGNGRCNLTNAEFNLKELVKNYNNGEFLFHAFSVFGPRETINFFEEIGVKIKIEKDNRAFPASNNADEVLTALNKVLVKNKVKILLDSEVVDIKLRGKKISKIILKDRQIQAENFIFCAGGKSYALTGSDGSVYKLIEKLGHTIESPIPALCPIIIKEEWVKKLQGISLKDIRINLLQNNKKQSQESGEILFTHFGISGPTVLNISGEAGSLLERGEVKISIDLFPILNQEQLSEGLDDVLKRNANKTIKNILSEFVPERMAETLLDVIELDKDKIANNMSKIEKVMVLKTLKNIEITAENLLGFNQSLVTRGGVSIKEIDHKTMKSKIINNLFFAGEIIDIDGVTGGFNLQECWSTGYIAGKSSVA